MRTRPRLWAGLFFLLTGLVVLSCNLNGESGRTFIHVETDSGWAAYDSLDIIWIDSASGDHGTLYQGPPGELDALNKLPADGYKGQKIDIIVRAFRGKELVHQETRHFDGKDADAIVIDTLKINPIPVVPDPDSLPEETRRSSRLPRVALITVDAAVSIRDSVAFSATAWLDSGDLKAYAWDYDGDAVYEGETGVSGKSILIQGGYRYPDPGAYSVTLKVLSDGDSIATARLTVQVLQDLPLADAGRDTTIYVGDALRLQGKGKDALGRIEKSEWKIGSAAFTEARGDAGLVSTQAPGDIACVFRVTDDDGQSVSDTMWVHVVSKSESVLTGIALSKGNLSPAFHPGITEYVDSLVSADSVLTVTATGLGTLTVEGAQAVSGQASAPLKVAAAGSPGSGRDTIRITVANGSLPPKTYRIALFRSAQAAESDNATLSGLELSAGKIQSDFTPDGISYALNVANSVASTWVTATAANGKSTLTIDNHPALSGRADSISLPVGIKFINIVVAAPNGEKKTYTVAVTRAPNANAYLKGLVVSGTRGDLGPEFNSKTYAYSIAVGHSVDTVWITSTDSVPTSTLAVDQTPVPSGNRFGPLPVKVGANLFEIVVTAQSSATLKYAVTVHRGKPENADLAGLELASATLDSAFSPSDTVYEALVGNEVTSVTLKAKPADSLATLAFHPGANVGLDTGSNPASVTVTAQNGSRKTYRIRILRAKNGDASLSALSLSAGALVPAFESQIEFYSLTVPNEIASATLSATASRSTTKVTLGDTVLSSGAASAAIPLKVGTDTLRLTAAAEDGTRKTYSVAVTRSLSRDVTLKELVLTAIGDDSLSLPLIPAFKDGVPHYSYTTVNFPHSLRVRPTATHDKASILVNGFEVTSGKESGIFPFKLGRTTTLLIEITSEDKEKKATATLDVYSQNPPPGDTLLTASGTFTVPAKVFSMVVMAVGGGGGGGSNAAPVPPKCEGGLCVSIKSPNGSGGGGGQGGVRLKKITVEPGQVIAYHIGTSGIPGPASSKHGVNGGTGGNTLFDSLTAPGGGGGGGPLQTTGTIHINGVAGQPGVSDAGSPFAPADSGLYAGNGGKGGGRFVRHFQDELGNQPLLGEGGIAGLYGWEIFKPPTYNTPGGLGGLGCGGGGAGSGTTTKPGGSGGPGFIYLYWGD